MRRRRGYSVGEICDNRLLHFKGETKACRGSGLQATLIGSLPRCRPPISSEADSGAGYIGLCRSQGKVCPHYSLNYISPPTPTDEVFRARIFVRAYTHAAAAWVTMRSRPPTAWKTADQVRATAGGSMACLSSPRPPPHQTCDAKPKQAVSFDECRQRNTLKGR